MHYRLILIFLIPFISYAQHKNCSNTFIEKKYNDAIRTYLDDDYEVEFTDYFKIPNNQKVELKKSFDSDFEYIVILVSPQDAASASIEILDQTREQQEFEKETLNLDSDFVYSEFEPDYDGIYNIICTVSYKRAGDYCSVLTVLKREVAPEPKKQK